MDDVGARAVAALRRIAFLLERADASTYRVQAFRGAVAVVAAAPAGDLARRAGAGTLAELRGIGPRTAQVIAEAVAGRTPAYLAELEAALAAEPAPAGGELRAALRGDLHAHTEASDGSAPIEDMAVTAVELGHAYLAITDHSPRLTVANGLSAQRLRAQVERIGALNARLAPFRLLTGIEVDILEDGSLDQEPELLARLDVVVGSVHSKLAMEPAAMTRRLLRAVENPHLDVLGHCTGRKLGAKPRPESRFDAERVFAACADRGVAVEVNSRPDRLDPPHRLVDAALAAGCLLTVDSDAHAPGQLDWLAAGCARLAEHDVDPDRVVTTWDADRLLSWTGRAPSPPGR